MKAAVQVIVIVLLAIVAVPILYPCHLCNEIGKLLATAKSRNSIFDRLESAVTIRVFLCRVRGGVA